MTNPVAGEVFTLYLDFYNEASGSLINGTAVQLDITYGGEVGLVADYAGPFYFTGAVLEATGVLYQISTGQYAFDWLVPTDVYAGVYTANWSVTYGPDNDVFLVTENFYVSQGSPLPPYMPSGDIGFWSGSFSYQPSWADSAFNINFGATDANSVTWLWQKIEGWDSPPVSGQVTQRASDQGGWPTPQYYAPRTMTVTCMASAPTQALRDQARAQFQQIIPVNDLALMAYNEPVAKQTEVRRSGQIVESYPTLCDVVFTCVIVAPDPRKYSTVQKSVTCYLNTPTGATIPWTLPVTFPAQVPGSSIQVTNSGTFETRPVITITGPVTTPTLVNVTTGQTVSWTDLELNTGDQLVVDFDAKQPQLNGASAPADYLSSWWVMNPGNTTILLGGTTSGGASMTVQWRDAWI